MNRISISKGKRAKRTGNKVKTIGIIIFIIIIITMLIILKIKMQDDNKNVVPPDTSLIDDVPLATSSEEEQPVVKEDEIVSVEDMPKKMGKYEVLGKLVIEKIDLEKYVLSPATLNSLDMSVAKLNGEYTAPGPDMNRIGNFCIAGHNYPKLFKRLRDLSIGDEFYLISADGRKVTYVIYDKYSIDPYAADAEKCLEQDTGGKREVTLLTCDPGAKTRLVLKSEEKI